VVVLTRPEATEDDYGNESVDWGSAEPGTTYNEARLEQTDAREVTEGRDVLVSDWELTLRAGAVIGGRDRVREGGRTFEVVGSPNTPPTPDGPVLTWARLRLIA
jgi:hypothetical protein